MMGYNQYHRNNNRKNVQKQISLQSAHKATTQKWLNSSNKSNLKDENR